MSRKGIKSSSKTPPKKKSSVISRRMKEIKKAEEGKWKEQKKYSKIQNKLVNKLNKIMKNKNFEAWDGAQPEDYWLLPIGYRLEWDDEFIYIDVKITPDRVKVEGKRESEEYLGIKQPLIFSMSFEMENPTINDIAEGIQSLIKEFEAKLLLEAEKESKGEERYAKLELEADSILDYITQEIRKRYRAGEIEFTIDLKEFSKEGIEWASEDDLEEVIERRPLLSYDLKKRIVEVEIV